jgi:hypothetical protein
MPIPKRGSDETKNEFLSRCMGDSKMNAEYPETAQRYAVCNSGAKGSLQQQISDTYEEQAFGSEEIIFDEDSMYIPEESEYVDFGEASEEYIVAEKKGLWENIRDKKKREGKNYKPAKPGDPDRPSKDAWKLAQSQAQKLSGMMEHAYDSKEAAMSAAKKMGLDGVFSHTSNGKTYWFPGCEMKELEDWIEVEEELAEAKQKSQKKVKLNNPFRTPGGPKKFSVYVKNDKGNIVKVNFGDPNMSIKRDDPEARKGFRARHQCDTNPGPKWKARYWSCKFWSKTSVTDLT